MVITNRIRRHTGLQDALDVVCRGRSIDHGRDHKVTFDPCCGRGMCDLPLLALQGATHPPFRAHRPLAFIAVDVEIEPTIEWRQLSRKRGYEEQRLTPNLEHRDRSRVTRAAYAVDIWPIIGFRVAVKVVGGWENEDNDEGPGSVEEDGTWNDGGVASGRVVNLRPVETMNPYHRQYGYTEDNPHVTGTCRRRSSPSR